jgi:hypothetical protein
VTVDDIVERLRNHWRAAGQGCTSLCRECTAADEIDRLRAEVERLRAENERLLKAMGLAYGESARGQHHYAERLLSDAMWYGRQR